MSETTYLVRDGPDQPRREAVVLRSSARAERLSRAGLYVTAVTGGAA